MSLLHVNGHYVTAQNLCEVKLIIERHITCIGIFASNIIVPEAVGYSDNINWCHTRAY